jgi:hypothetical protein
VTRAGEFDIAVTRAGEFDIAVTRAGEQDMSAGEKLGGSRR